MPMISLTVVQYGSLGNICVARGDTTGGFMLHASSIETKIKQAFNCVAWNPFPVDFWTGIVLKY